MPIDRSRYGSQGTVMPKLDARDIKGPKTVLTVMAVREVNGRNNPFWAMQFEEFPEKEYTTNRTQEDAFLDAVDAGILPGELWQWVGHRIPMHKRTNTNPETKKSVEKLYPVPVEEWANTIAEFDRAVEQVKRPAGRGKK